MSTYTLEYLPSAAVGAIPVDISNFVHTLDDTTFYSDGRVSTSSLTLQANFGQFVTDSRGGTTPILSQYDLLRLTYIDSDGLAYQHIFEIINDLGQTTRQSEYLLPLTLEGRERNLGLIPFSGFFDPPISHFEIAQRILSVYGDSIDITTQPRIANPFTTVQLPDFNPNFWDFQYIDNCLDALIEVVKSANLSVAAGGGGDRFSIIFVDALDTELIEVRIASQGSTNTQPPFVTITGDPIYNPIQVVDKIKQPFTGSVVMARGRPGSGGTPREGDIYRSRLEFYQRTQPYDNSTTYAAGAYAMFGSQLTNPELNLTGQVYQADVETTGNLPTDAAFWSPVSAGAYIGDIQYSPLTIDKAALYKNECTNPGAAFDSDSETSPKMIDCNIVIEDVETKRDWVYFRSNTDVPASLTTQKQSYLFQGTDYYPGFRILVDTALGTGAGSFDPTLDAFGTGAGNDPNGKPYADNAVIRVGGIWFVIKEHEDFDQILSREEGLFEWNVDFVVQSRFPASDTSNTNRRFRQAASGTPNGWRALGEQFLANDCLHSPSSITNVEGLITPVAEEFGGNDYTTNSAVQIIYEYGNPNEKPEWRNFLDQIVGFFPVVGGFLATMATNAAQTLYDLFLTPQYRNAGWWITFTAPWPFNTSNGISEAVGEIYGGQTLAELEDHPYFDVYNQRVAYSGKAGFNEPDSADLLEITGVTFLYNLDITVDGTTIPFTGDIPVSYWCIDDNGTIWKSKQVYRFLKDTQRFTFDFGDFAPVYRARSPFGISNIVTNILTPELEIRERLIPSRIKIQGFMLELAYDEKGRYMPNLVETVIKPTIASLFTPGTNVQYIGTIDYLQWVKTPLAIENGSSLGITPDRAIFTDIRDYPNITNIEQLQRAATADFNLDFFQYEQYTLTQNDRADRNLQETVYFREPFLIPNSDQVAANVNPYSGVTSYIPNDVVISAGTIYTCIAPTTGNAPPNTTFWRDEGTVAVPNTREVVVSEIALSVTNGKEWQRSMTINRRIPRVVG